MITRKAEVISTHTVKAWCHEPTRWICLDGKRELVERWKQYFDKHMNCVECGSRAKVESQSNGGNVDASSADDENQQTFTLRDVRYLILQLKNNKDGFEA